MWAAKRPQSDNWGQRDNWGQIIDNWGQSKNLDNWGQSKNFWQCNFEYFYSDPKYIIGRDKREAVVTLIMGPLSLYLGKTPLSD